MPTERFNSEHFIQLTRQKQATDTLLGKYDFETFSSGLQIHGGSIHPQKNIRCQQLVDPYINFIILLDGTLRFRINHENHVIHANGGKVLMIAIPEESLFTKDLRQGEYCQKVALRGIEKWLSSYPQQDIFTQTVREWALTDPIKALVQTFLKEKEYCLPSLLQKEAKALELLAQVWQLFEKTPSLCTFRPVPAHQQSFQEQLKLIFEPTLTVSALAKRLHMSERTLQRRMQEYFGINANEWLRHKKMKFALYALQHLNLSVGEIAYACGYKHVSNFTQAFKHYFHTTPAHFD